MSEVKRYAVIHDMVYGHDKFGPVCRESEEPHFVLAYHYDDAKSKLAELQATIDQLQSELERLKGGQGEPVAELSQHLESVIAMFAPGEDKTNRTLIAARTCLDKVKEMNQ